MADAKSLEQTNRAQDFREKLLSTGLTITEFQRASGLTRNVVYNLSIGQAPSSRVQSEALENAFERLRKIT